MADAAEILSGLRDLRMPEPTGYGPLADAAAAFSLGLAAALVVALLLRAVTTRPPTRREAALAELAETRRLDPAERLTAQAALLKRVAAELGASGPGRGGAHGEGSGADRGATGWRRSTVSWAPTSFPPVPAPACARASIGATSPWTRS